MASTPLPTSRMIARGSTRLTVPVMSSPSRLGELVEDDVALGLAEALEDDLLGRLGVDAAERLAIELLGLDEIAGLGVGLRGLAPPRGVNSVSGSSTSSTTRACRGTTRIWPVSASIWTWMSSSPAMRR